MKCCLLDVTWSVVRHCTLNSLQLCGYCMRPTQERVFTVTCVVWGGGGVHGAHDEPKVKGSKDGFCRSDGGWERKWG